MSRPRALVAEDEVPQRRRLCELLGELWPELEIIAECGDGLVALEALTGQRPDIAFLDIRMPGLTGLEVARAAEDTHAAGPAPEDLVAQHEPVVDVHPRAHRRHRVPRPPRPPALAVLSSAFSAATGENVS